MFDIGFSELVVIAVVALIVIGPEKLPTVARTLGHLFGRMQRYVNDVKADIAREVQFDELRKLQSEMEDAARNIHESVTKEMQEARDEFDKLSHEAAVDEAAAPPPSTSPSEPELALEPATASGHAAAPEEHSAADSGQLTLDLGEPSAERKSA